MIAAVAAVFGWREWVHHLFMVGCAGLFSAFSAQAANWLMLQGTESSSSAPRAKLWGFVQPTYQYADGSLVAAGAWKGSEAQFNQRRPQLDSSQGFSLRRARIGVRGQGHPLNAKVNYFFLAEFGSNGITWPNKGLGAARLTDASVTLSYIPGVRVRAGLFKTPTAEEGLQAIHVFDYINFTSFTDQMLLERYFATDGSGTKPAPGTGPVGGTNVNAPIGPVGAFRDTGIQIFDSFMVSTWDISYALMLGNGNGINGANDNSRLEGYAYFSGEKIFGASKGARRKGLKMFAWGQQGKRDLITETTSVKNSYDRNRYGLGFTFRKSIWRAAAEYMIADGMIFNGTDGGARRGSKSNPLGPNGTVVTSSFNMEPEEESDGYYLHLAAEVVKHLELDLRYDVLNRATKTAAKERRFDTFTLGAQWFFDMKNRITLNYMIRAAEAPNLPASHPANKILDEIDDMVSLQITSIF